MQDCNIDKVETIKDVDLMIEKHYTVFLTNDTTQEEKCDYLWLVYNSYLESDDSFFSTIAEGILIYASLSRGSYCFYLFDKKVYETYNDLRCEELTDKKTIKLKRLSPIFMSLYLPHIDKCEEQDCLPMQDSISIKNKRERDYLISKGFDYDKFKHLIDEYLDVSYIENEEMYKERHKIGKDIANMHFQLLAIKTGNPRFIAK